MVDWLVTLILVLILDTNSSISLCNVVLNVEIFVETSVLNVLIILSTLVSYSFLLFSYAVIAELIVLFNSDLLLFNSSWILVSNCNNLLFNALSADLT